MNGKHNNSQIGAQCCSTRHRSKPIHRQRKICHINLPSRQRQERATTCRRMQGYNNKLTTATTAAAATATGTCRTTHISSKEHHHPKGQPPNTTHFNPSYTQRLFQKPRHVFQIISMNVELLSPNQCPSYSFSENHRMRKEYGSWGNGQSNITQLYMQSNTSSRLNVQQHNLLIASIYTINDTWLTYMSLIGTAWNGKLWSCWLATRYSNSFKMSSLIRTAIKRLLSLV